MCLANRNELIGVPNPLVSEAALPYFSSKTKLHPRAMRETAFDFLHHPFDRTCPLYCKQNVKVVAHHYKGMKFVLPQLAIAPSKVEGAEG